MSPYMSTDQPRTIVLVGHDVGSDLDKLLGLGVRFHDRYKVAHTADTKDIHQYVFRADQGCSLRRVLDDVHVPAWNLHNAGNDAFYTLRALVELAFVVRPEEDAPDTKSAQGAQDVTHEEATEEDATQEETTQNAVTQEPVAVVSW